MVEVIWGIFGVLVGAFVLYFFAHSWLIRPAIERIDREGRFPFVDRVLGPRQGVDWAAMREWSQKDEARLAARRARRAEREARKGR